MSEEEVKPDGPLATSVDRLRQEMEKWFEVARNSGSRAWESLVPRGGEKRVVPAADVVETADDVRVFLDIPGVDPRTLEVNLTGNMLTVKGIKAPSPSEEGQVSHLDERSAGSFARPIPLPTAVNPEQVSAEAKDGVLTIVLMKSERSKSHQIPVQTARSETAVGLS